MQYDHGKRPAVMLHFQANTKSKVTNKYQLSHFPFSMLTSKKRFEKQNACSKLYIMIVNFLYRFIPQCCWTHLPVKRHSCPAFPVFRLPVQGVEIVQ